MRPHAIRTCWSGGWRAGSACRMSHAVDDSGHRQDQARVLSVLDLDAVGVSDTEPLLGDLGDLVASALDLVLMVDDVALDLQVVTVLDLDLEPFAQRGDQGLLHRGELLPV